MLKQISKQDLRLGMYIHDLNCQWIDHPFLRNSFMLRRDADLAGILDSGITTVWIDTLKGMDLDREPQAVLPSPGDSQDRRPAAPPPPRLGHLEELPTARQVLLEANQAIAEVLTDVRLGRQVQVARLEPVVARIADSVLRSPGTLVSLCRLREADKATFQHSVSACTLLILFGLYLDMDKTSLRELGMGGLLHDVGKMGVPDHILNKPGRLTVAEQAIMRDHVRLGLETLRRTPGITGPVLQVTGEHHERCDGSGYPRGLLGSAISLPGRMAAIVDVYDAVTSNRIYHAHLEPAAALGRLYKRSPRHFDLDLVQHFIQAIGIYPVGSLVRLESNRLAVVLEQNQGALLRPKVRVVRDLAMNRALAPFDLDLSGTEAAGDGIQGHEEPGRWDLDPHRYLMDR